MSHYRKDCISFFITSCCNLRCKYCYVGNHDSHDRTLDLTFAQIGFRDYIATSEARHIRFFGAGEPTQNFEQIKAIWDFAYAAVGAELKAEIQTNGVFSPAIARWLAQHMSIVWLSLDGPPDVQNSLRPMKDGSSSSAIVEQSIATLHEYGQHDLLVGVRATITPETVDRQVDLIRYCRKLGVTAIFSDPIFPPVGSLADTVERPSLNADFIMEYAREYLRARRYAERIGTFYGSVLSVNFDEPTEYACRACLPSPHLTVDGYVTCCDMAFSGEIFPELVYGTFDSAAQIINYDQSRISQIRMRKASNLKECAGCSVLMHCAGGCLGEGLNETGRLLGVKKDYCQAIRYLAQRMPLDAGPYPYLHP